MNSGALVAAVVDERFVQAAEGVAGVGAEIFEIESLENVHHEIGAGAIDGHHFHGRRRIGRGFQKRRRAGAARPAAGDAAFAARGIDDQRSRACGRGPQEIAAIHRIFFGLSHDAHPLSSRRRDYSHTGICASFTSKGLRGHFAGRMPARCSATQSRKRSIRARSRHIN